MRVSIHLVKQSSIGTEKVKLGVDAIPPVRADVVELAVSLRVGVVTFHWLELTEEGSVWWEREDWIILAREAGHVLQQLLNVGVLSLSYSQEEEDHQH